MGLPGRVQTLDACRMHGATMEVSGLTMTIYSTEKPLLITSGVMNWRDPNPILPVRPSWTAIRELQRAEGLPCRADLIFNCSARGNSSMPTRKETWH